ncbi:MAG: AAA family ATPase, partial [Nitrososphaerales archaeon]
DLYRDYPDSINQTGIEARLDKLKKGLSSYSRDPSSSALHLQDQRFGAYLSKLKPEVFDRLDCWFPDDSLQVSYSPRADGRDFRPIEQGSPGQKTAAILAFLLSYGEEPMILDQPEDDLDNHLIYDLIVKQLREKKRTRQIIVVTHNPNIVVNGDAELVLALDVRGGQTRIIQQGGLQEQAVRDEICRIMEGGREAFERRYQRIGMGATDV